ncbi:hypothetical protein RJT34_14761 [Clitoria ternatea]|uniref:Pentatricopeptide repeat-containing protein n=1 Tax=Clitoria ternatea TaxID=43366 RepID=A0AAN9PMY2_CLITE
MGSLGRLHRLLQRTANHRHFQTLTEAELSEINNLIPRLCESNQLSAALRLTTTALLVNPSLHTLPLSPLIQSLTSHQDLTHTMSLLTHLFHTPPSHPYISPIALSLLNSYFHNNSPNHALKIFRWLRRPHSPSPPDHAFYEVVIRGLCSHRLAFHALEALRDMLAHHPQFLPSFDSTDLVYRALLMEARVDEALELNAAITRLLSDGENRENVLEVLERLIAQWTM